MAQNFSIKKINEIFNNLTNILNLYNSTNTDGFSQDTLKHIALSLGGDGVIDVTSTFRHGLAMTTQIPKDNLIFNICLSFDKSKLFVSKRVYSLDKSISIDLD